MKTPLYNQNAEVVGDIDLNDKVFAVAPNTHLMAESVRVQQSNARGGLSNTKTRGEVSGGGKKPWKQKGTGKARAGSTRSPIWRHGGVVFGPRSERNWSLKINKKAKTKALFMSLSDKAKHSSIVLVDSISLEPVKTKQFVSLLGKLKEASKTTGKKVLFVLPKADASLVRASRNIPSVTPIIAANLNIVEILKADTMLMLKDSLQVIEKTFLAEEKKASGK